MKNISYVYTYLFTLIAGVLLIILHNRSEIFEAISIVLGVCFLIAGVMSLINTAITTKQAKAEGARISPTYIIVSGATVFFGLLMVIHPTMFVNYLMYAIGAVMIIVGLVQLFNFMPRMSDIGFSRLFLIVPCLSILAGIIVFMAGADTIKDVLALLTGIVLTVYSVNGFIGYFNRQLLLEHEEIKENPKSEIVEIK